MILHRYGHFAYTLVKQIVLKYSILDIFSCLERTMNIWFRINDRHSRLLCGRNRMRGKNNSKLAHSALVDWEPHFELCCKFTIPSKGVAMQYFWTAYLWCKKNPIAGAISEQSTNLAVKLLMFGCTKRILIFWISIREILIKNTSMKKKRKGLQSTRGIFMT